jgi:type VI secretion system FHA domain protein
MFSLKIVKGAELAEGVVSEMRLPAQLIRFCIGRDPANQWPIPDRTLSISARHCEIVATTEGAVLRDLSTNGTFVNGGSTRLAGDHPLQDGDRIEFGPYAILVQGPNARAAAVPEAHAKLNLPTASVTAVVDTAPRVAATAAARGGDPAAMFASGSAPERPGLTEILRSSPPPEAADVEVTKIRPAPRPLPVVPVTSSKAAGVPQAPAASAPVPAPLALPRAGAGAISGRAQAPPPAFSGVTEELLRRLAMGLGIPVERLAGQDAARVAEQVGSVARTAVTVLRQLLEQQAAGRRRIGSRAPALQAMREAHPLHLAASPEAALLGLLAPGTDAAVALGSVATELATHQERLLTAFRSAVARLGTEMAPASLERAMPGPSDAEHKARLWDLYGTLWRGIGLAPGQPWTEGFLEAALLHLAAAYDVHGKG